MRHAIAGTFVANLMLTAPLPQRFTPKAMQTARAVKLPVEAV